MSREITVRLAGGNEVWSVDYSKLSAVSVTVENDEAHVRKQIDAAIHELASQGAAPLDFWDNPFAIVLGGQNQSPIDAGQKLALEKSFGVRRDGSAYALNIGFDVLTFSDLDRAIEAGLARGNSNEFVLIPAQRGAAGSEELLLFLNAVGVGVVVEAITGIGSTSTRKLTQKIKHRVAIRRVRKMMKSFEQNGISDPFLIENLLVLCKSPTTKRIQKAFQLPRGLTEDILFKSGRVQNKSTGVWELIEIPEAIQLREKWQQSIYRNTNDQSQG